MLSDSDLPVDIAIETWSASFVNFKWLLLAAISSQHDWSCRPCFLQFLLNLDSFFFRRLFPTFLLKTEACVFVLQNQIILCWVLLSFLGCLWVEYSLLLFLPFFKFFTFSLLIKPIDDTHHVFGVSVLNVVQVNKILLLIVQLSVAVSINLYLKELRRFSLSWQDF